MLFASCLTMTNAQAQNNPNDRNKVEPCTLDDTLALLPGYALRRASNVMFGLLLERLTPLDLRQSEASVLLLLRNKTDITASEIGRTLDIQRANMVPLLNRLEAAGLLERRPIDRKSFAIVLTAHGQIKVKAVEKIVTSFEEDLLARIPPEHRDHFLPALNALWR
jgi:DNA-binding MarR family transcriptional regulator